MILLNNTLTIPMQKNTNVVEMNYENVSMNNVTNGNPRLEESHREKHDRLPHTACTAALHCICQGGILPLTVLRHSNSLLGMTLRRPYDQHFHSVHRSCLLLLFLHQTTLQCPPHPASSPPPSLSPAEHTPSCSRDIAAPPPRSQASWGSGRAADFVYW